LQVLHETPLPLEQCVRDLPAGLAEVVATAMARDREARFDSLNTMIHALRRVLEPVRARQRQDVMQFRSLQPLTTVTEIAPTAREGSLRAVVRTVPEPGFPRWPAIAIVSAALIGAFVSVVLLRPNPTQPVASPAPPLKAAAAAPPERDPRLDMIDMRDPRVPNTLDVRVESLEPARALPEQEPSAVRQRAADRLKKRRGPSNQLPRAADHANARSMVLEDQGVIDPFDKR
jgi:hypothetical protein